MNNPRNLFYIFIIGFCVGVAFVPFLGISSYILSLLLVVSLAICSFLVLHSKIKQKKICHPIIVLCVFVISVSFGGMRMKSFEDRRIQLPLTEYEGTSVTLIGRVVEESSGKNLLLSTGHIVVDSKPQEIEEEKVVLTNIVGVFDYGDILAVSGKLDVPKNIKSKDGKDFDYVSYLKTKGVFHVVSFAKVLEEQKNTEVTLRSILYGVKNWFEGNIESVVSEPESSLASGVTIAGKGALPKDVQDDFVKAGIIHIVVLSGYNIAIVIRAMMYLFGFLGRRARTLLAGCGIILFVIMTGGTAPVVRSAIMASITLLGVLSYKDVSQNRTLLGAVFVMVLLSPYSLLYDASFILSILSTFAIVNGVDFVKRYLGFVTEKANTRQVLAETLATQLFVLPYILYQIGRLSVVAPLSNIIVLPFISWIMLGTFVVGMIAFIPFVSLPFAGIVTILSGTVIWLAHLFANIPFASFEIRYFPLWAMIGCYGIYFVLWYIFEYKRNERIEKVTVSDSNEPY